MTCCTIVRDVHEPRDPEALEQHLPTSPKERKDAPIFTGVIKYFPDAIVAIARLSKIGNEQHNPGQPLHWDRRKSMDHGDCLLRHQVDVGTLDSDGVRHATKVAWRALAQLQIELEAVQLANPEATIEAIARMDKAMLDTLPRDITDKFALGA